MAQRKKKIAMCNLIAKNLLAEYYNTGSLFKKNKDSVKIFCQEMSFESDYVRRFLFKLTRQEVDMILVGAVIDSLPPLFQKFLKYKYGSNKSFDITGISRKIGLSPAQIYNWEREILTKIYDAIRFRLTIKDIFHRKKIINMMEAIALLLECADEIDPAGEFIDDFWKKSLLNYYNNYRQLLNIVEDCIQNPDLKNMNRTISIKLANPFADKTDLAEKCHCTCGTVGRHEHDFEKLCREFVCA